MRFIRTKDGVYDTKTVGSIRDENLKAWFISIKIINDDEIIKQADTIEKLCDGFYWDWEDKFSPHNFNSYSLAKDTWGEYINDCLEENEIPERNMYGFIKTNKGLIYVAKMNENGELILL